MLMDFYNRHESEIKVVGAIVAGGVIIYLVGSSWYRIGKVFGAARMADLVNLKLGIPVEQLPDVFEAAQVVVKL